MLYKATVIIINIIIEPHTSNYYANNIIFCPLDLIRCISYLKFSNEPFILLFETLAFHFSHISTIKWDMGSLFMLSSCPLCILSKCQVKHKFDLSSFRVTFNQFNKIKHISDLDLRQP